MPESGVASVSATIAFPRKPDLKLRNDEKNICCTKQGHWTFYVGTFYVDNGIDVMRLKKFTRVVFLTFQPPFAADPLISLQFSNSEIINIKKLRKLTLQEWGINKFNHWHNIEVGITKIHSILCNLL